jgi:Flp pilus assembly pilin Flp
MTDISIRIHMLLTSAASSLVSKLHREEGQDLIEYALLGGLIAAAIVAAATLLALSGALKTMADSVGRCIDFTPSTPCGGQTVI